MKNLHTFEEFINESFLNEAFTNPAKANIKKIGDITRKFIEKDLPNLLSKYNCTVEKSPVGKYIIDHPTQGSLIDIHLNKMNRNRFGIILMYAYVNIFSGPKEHANKIPFSIEHPNDIEKYSGPLVTDMVMRWQYSEGSDEDNTLFSNPSIVSEYQDTVDKWLDGIEQDLKYYIKHQVIKD
jgi:hypothetical protein